MNELVGTVCVTEFDGRATTGSFAGSGMSSRWREEIAGVQAAQRVRRVAVPDHCQSYEDEWRRARGNGCAGDAQT
jgi:hypothetical protein